jgi:catechol 2,3-dioxygenase-like lactoylglutathione lyase family enzyme
MRLQHVSVPAPLDGSEQARVFYAGVLGLPEKPVPDSLQRDRFVWFDAGPGELEVHVFLVSEPDRPSARAHFCLDVGDLAALRSRLEAAGVDLVAARSIPNRPRFFCRDPFGNRIEITSIQGPYRTP